MPISELKTSDRDAIGRCLRAALEGPFFPRWEFATLLGVSPEEMSTVVHEWPDVDDRSEVVKNAVTNTLVNLIGYPHRQEAALAQLVGDETVLTRLLVAWKGTG